MRRTERLFGIIQTLRSVRKPVTGQQLADDAEVVVIAFPPVQKGQSVRLRIIETYTDPGRYYLEDDELVWDRGGMLVFGGSILAAFVALEATRRLSQRWNGVLTRRIFGPISRPGDIYRVPAAVPFHQSA